MTRITYNGQGSTTPPNAPVAACSGLAAGITTRSVLMTRTTPISGYNPSIRVAGGGTVYRCLHWESSVASPGLLYWDAGNWDTRFRPNSSNPAMILDEVHICAIDSGTGANVATIGSATGLGIACTLGLKIVNVTGSAHVASPTDSPIIIWGFKSNNAFAQSVNVRTNLSQRTPLAKRKDMDAALSGDGDLSALLTVVTPPVVAPYDGVYNAQPVRGAHAKEFHPVRGAATGER